MGRHKAPYHDVMITYYIDICMLHDYLYVNTNMHLNKHDLLKAERVEWFVSFPFYVASQELMIFLYDYFITWLPCVRSWGRSSK